MTQKNGLITLSCPAKMKDAPRPIDKHFHLKEIELPWRDYEGRIETSVVLTSTGGHQPRPKLTPVQQAALDALTQACTASGGPVTEQTWREAFYATRSDKKQDTNRQAFGRARDDLISAGVISGDGDEFQPVPGHAGH
jgi:hypothetical protein